MYPTENDGASVPGGIPSGGAPGAQPASRIESTSRSDASFFITRRTPYRLISLPARRSTACARRTCDESHNKSSVGTVITTHSSPISLNASGRTEVCSHEIEFFGRNVGIGILCGHEDATPNKGVICTHPNLKNRAT